MSTVYDLMPRFRKLFSGLDSAFGTGKGQWVKRPPRPDDFLDHLEGKGSGIGIGPLRPDNTVMFAAIDMDEPDFDAAQEMQRYIPGRSFIERSRSGNAHVWVFFREPCEAWVAMGILRAATEAAGRPRVEVFPKNHDFERVRMGNYINLPYHGSERPVICMDVAGSTAGCPRHSRGAGGQAICSCMATLRLAEFLDRAEANLQDPDLWRKKANFLVLEPPSERTHDTTFGEQARLHICAEHVLSGDAGPITYGHQNLTMFMLAKCLSNWSQMDHDEALTAMLSANEDLFDPGLPQSEVRRILGNAERGQYTSTGCDDPVVSPFTHPDCPIAHPRRS